MKTLHTAIAALMISMAAFGVAKADDITADVLTYDGNTKIVTASGNVVIHANQGATITAANGEYHFEDKSAVLQGSVHYSKDSATMTAGTLYVMGDKTVRGVGNVYYADQAENRSLQGDDVTYNSETGYAKVEGNGKLTSQGSTFAAPHMEGNLKEIRIVATGGVNFTDETHNAKGYGDQAVYTRTGQQGQDGKLVLTGNAWVEQNGNTFVGPELVLRDAEKIVETTGRSMITITNTNQGREAPSNDAVPPKRSSMSL